MRIAAIISSAALRYGGSRWGQWGLACALSLSLLVFFPWAPITYVVLWGLAAAALWRLARRTLSLPTAALVTASLFYFAFWLYYRPNILYTNDLPYHIRYMRHLMAHPFDPYSLSGVVSWHPPLYYWLCAGLMALTSLLPFFDPLTAVRLLSLACYLAFILYGLRTLRYAAGREDAAYYIGCLLIIFWPVSMNMATRINNDIALYPLWAAMFYYFVRWWHDGDLRDLARSLVATGLAFLIKSNALIPLAIWLAGVASGHVLGRLPLRRLWQPEMRRAYGVFALCLIANLGKWFYIRATLGWDVDYTHLGTAATSGRLPGWLDFAGFDLAYYIGHPFTQGLPQPDAYNYFLKTLSFGEYPWRHGALAGAINAVLLLFLGTLAVSCVLAVAASRRGRGAFIPPLLGVLLPLAGSAGYYLSKRMEVNLDARYILPFIVPLSILCVYGIRAMRGSPRTRVLGWLLAASAALLPLLGMAFYLGQYWW